MKSWRSEFPGLVSYTRFVEYTPSALVPLIIFLRTRCLGRCTSISFVDSTSLDVCLNQRIHSPKCLLAWQRRGRPRLAGFLASNCTW
jgi:hypothetical protein